MLAYIQYYEQLHIKNAVNRQMDDYGFIYKEDNEYDDEFREIETVNKPNALDIITKIDFIDFE